MHVIVILTETLFNEIVPLILVTLSLRRRHSAVKVIKAVSNTVFGLFTYLQTV